MHFKYLDSSLCIYLNYIIISYKNAFTQKINIPTRKKATIESEPMIKEKAQFRAVGFFKPYLFPRTEKLNVLLSKQKPKKNGHQHHQPNLQKGGFNHRRFIHFHRHSKFIRCHDHCDDNEK